MIIALAVSVFLLAALVFVLFGAHVELFDQVKQIRKFLDLEDTITTLDLRNVQGWRPSEVGLPDEIDLMDHALVLLLSNKCATCQTLAATMRGGRLPPATWVIAVPVSGDITQFLDTYELRNERVLVDRDERIVGQLGLDVTPAAVLVENGRLAAAQTVPSVRHLRAIQPSLQRPRHSELSSRPQQ